MIGSYIIERVLESGTTAQDIEDLIQQARKTENVSGRDRDRLLAVSAVALGAERGGDLCFSLLVGIAGLLEASVGTLTGLIQTLDDQEHVAAVRGALDEFKKTSTSHASLLSSIFFARSNMDYGLPIELVSAICKSETTSLVDAERIGLLVCVKDVGLFQAWYALKEVGALEKMECRCAACVRNQYLSLRLASQVSDENPMLSGDPSTLLHMFGQSVIQTIQTRYAQLQSGVYEPTEPARATDPEFINDLLSRMR